MPGFKDRLGETKMWQVSVLLKDADKLPASVKTELSSGVVPVSPPPAGTLAPTPAKDDDHDHIH
jgi:hypothetical protein